MDQTERIAELEDQVRQLERRVADLKEERDAERALVADMRQHVEDANDMIESWIYAFDMAQNEAGEWCWADGLMQRYDDLHDKYIAVLKDWNQFVPRYNAVVVPRLRNFGRPLAASDAQRDDVLRRRKRGQSLRTIAAEMNLSLRTVRTITEKANGTDRSTLARLQRIAPDKMAQARERAGRKARKSLPTRIAALQKNGSTLIKRAKGLRD